MSTFYLYIAIFLLGVIIGIFIAPEDVTNNIKRIKTKGDNSPIVPTFEVQEKKRKLQLFKRLINRRKKQ